MFYAQTVGNCVKELEVFQIFPSTIYPSSIHQPIIHPSPIHPSSILHPAVVLEPLPADVGSRNTLWTFLPSISPHIPTKGQAAMSSELSWTVRWDQRKVRQACLMFLITSNTFCLLILTRHLSPPVWFCSYLTKNPVQMIRFVYF